MKPSLQLRDAHAVVVGGSTGVGAALVRRLSSEGVRCTVIALPGDDLDKVVAEVGGTAIPLDLSDLDQVDGAIDRAIEVGGPVDVLVCNAAVSPAGPFQDMTAKELRDATVINMVSQMELIRQVIPGMVARGAGTITTTGSLSTEMSMIHLGGYVPSKAGLTKCALDLQAELQDYGIRVFTFLLGSVKGTALANKAIEDPVVDFIERRAGDMGVLTPERVADRMTEVIGSDQASALITIPKVAAGLVQFRNLPVRLLEPVMTRPARKFKRGG